MSVKGKISQAIRSLGLSHGVDTLRYAVERLRNRAANAEFRRQHPDVALPPDYLMYESFRLDYARYYEGGMTTARWLAGLIGRYSTGATHPPRVLDWGCGPGRTVRHLPTLLPAGSEVFGTDYNERSVAWCRAHLPGIDFNLNTLAAKLPYPDGHFSAIYGISIFTHLSEPLHHAWLAELIRVLRPGGVLILTLQGDNFRAKLAPAEQAAFDRGELVVRGNVKEGHRTYSAFHPEAFARGFFAELTVLEHLVEPAAGKGYVPQDTWVLRK